MERCRALQSAAYAAFESEREAKEFFVSKNCQRSKARERPALRGRTQDALLFRDQLELPNIASVSEVFDREYGQDKYEKKITHLIREAATHDRNQSPELYNQWWDAIPSLQRGDHYILVMISLGCGALVSGSQTAKGSKSPPQKLRTLRSWQPLTGNEYQWHFSADSFTLALLRALPPSNTPQSELRKRSVR